MGMTSEVDIWPQHAFVHTCADTSPYIHGTHKESGYMYHIGRRFVRGRRVLMRVFVCLFFVTRVLLCVFEHKGLHLGGIPYIDQAGLELIGIASVSLVLELMVCPTTPSVLRPDPTM